MPAEVIIHQSAAACKKYKDMMFTDKNGNIINDANDPETYINDLNNTYNNTQNNIEMLGVEENEIESDMENDTTRQTSQRKLQEWKGKSQECEMTPNTELLHNHQLLQQ